MRDPQRIDKILSKVGDALLDKGDDYSVGKLVAELEGDGMTPDSDPFHVWDEHFYNDVAQVDEWAHDPRDPQKTHELLDLFAEYWETYPDMRFCQIVCNAHSLKNGMSGFETDESPYAEPISELTDDQLRDYLQGRLEDE